MANKDQPRGAEPAGRVLRVTKYIAAGTVYPGDFVKMDTSGGIVVAAASNALCGVAAQKATSGQAVLVWDDPDQRFLVQSDDATEPAAQTALLANYNIVAGSPDSGYGISRHELDGNTGNTTGTLPLKLLALAPSPDNTYGGYADCIVVINNHQLGGGTGTDGLA